MAIFKLDFPRCDSDGAAVGGAPMQEPTRGGTETILVAEDEDLLRSVVLRILAAAGYRVLQARDGVEAVRVFRDHAGEVDLVLMDAVMPGQGGVEALGEIRSMAPGARIVLSSGYGDGLDDDEGSPAVDAEFLAKPYEADLLLRVVRRSLDGAAARH